MDEVEVTISNLAPVADDDSYTIDEDTRLVIQTADGLLKNDTDAGDDALSAVLESGPAHGTLTLNGDGSFSYEPDGDYNGEDTFTYKAEDGVVGGNDAPRITGEQPASNTTTTDRTPKISAMIEDPETRLARSDIKLYLDGRRFKRFSYSPDTGLQSRMTGRGLDYRKHTVRIVATDAEGLVTISEWDFVVKRK